MTIAPESRVAGVMIAGRPVGSFMPLDGRSGPHTGCPGPHERLFAVGYVVRRTFEGGRQLWQGRTLRLGYDVEVHAGVDAFDAALAAAKSYRLPGSSWAAVDALYVCGHRD